jgi:HAMP domain-containing protein
MLYTGSSGAFTPQALGGAEGTVTFSLGQNAQKLAPLVAAAQRQGRELTQTIKWGKAGDIETFRALPLLDRAHSVLGVLLVGGSRQELAILERRIRLVALQVAAGGIMLSLLPSYLATARLGRLKQGFTAAATQVASGNWDAHVNARSEDEFGQLASAFNRTMREIAEQRESLILAERVAAMREFAGRIAAGLKGPLFPFRSLWKTFCACRKDA